MQTPNSGRYALAQPSTRSLTKPTAGVAAAQKAQQTILDHYVRFRIVFVFEEPTVNFRKTIQQRLKLLAQKTSVGSRLIQTKYAYEFVNALDAMGWLRSRSSWESVDSCGQPVPWMTYGAVAFLEPRLRPQYRVFEYGSGNSTRWWAERVSWVVSYEHDSNWYEQTAPILPSNVSYHLRPLDTEPKYEDATLAHKGEFDVIVIDGRNRVACTLRSLQALNSEGVIVFDNSDRDKYRSAFEFLNSRGFKRLDFWGVGPINTYAWCTSVFYRDGNALGI